MQFVMGPVDTLDHAARLQDYGSKMGIDATRKWPERRIRRTLAGRNKNGCRDETRVDTIWQQLGLTPRSKK